MSWLKTLTVNSQAPAHGVIDILRQNMGGYRPARDLNTIHASDVTKDSFCARHVALLLLHEQTKKDEYISTALHHTFEIGQRTAEVVIDGMGDRAYGYWDCIRCGAFAGISKRPPKTGIPQCPHKKGHLWQYREPVFSSQEYGVSGSIDVLADLGQKLVVVELKIMKVEDWDALMAPLPEHRIRSALYLKLIADSGSPATELINLHEGRVLYVSRGYGKKNPVHNEILPYKEFVFKRDDDITIPYLRKGKAVKIFKEEGRMPAGICKTAVDKLAKSCTTCAACFSGKYPPDFKVEDL